MIPLVIWLYQGKMSVWLAFFAGTFEDLAGLYLTTIYATFLVEV